MEWTLAKLVEATGGRLYPSDLKSGEEHQPIRAVSTDTRRIQSGDCFVALVGEHFDGHRFISDAVQKGALAVVVRSGFSPITLPRPVSIIEVPDTLYALGELARYCRRCHPVPVVGITGSNGKTSTKEMVAAILSQKRQILKNQGNFNNLIGVPLTLLTFESSHHAAVIEMGINVPGEMGRLVEIVQPSVGLITNIHPAHLQGLHSVEGVLDEKGKLWSALQSAGGSSDGIGTEALAVVNLDDEHLVRLSQKLKHRILTYSLRDSNADVHLVGETESDNGKTMFRLAIGKETVPVELSVLGIHQVNNAVAAAAVAYGMGESPETIAEGLASHRPVGGRMQLHRLKDGTLLIDDTYNANPMSMLAAVESLKSMAKEGAKPKAQGTKAKESNESCTPREFVAVLGEMRELGQRSADLHREVGRKIAASGINGLITLGDLAIEIARGAKEGGMDPTACFHARSHEEIVTLLRKDWLGRSACMLVKGSRGMTMERVVEGMLAE